MSMGSETGEEEEKPALDRDDSVKSPKSDRLHQLILAGDQEEAERLINKGNDINRQDKSGKTPLHTAILSNQFRIVSKLLESGADVTISDDAGDTVLHTAIRVGSERLVLTLIQQGGCDINALGRNSATPLHLASEMDNADICKILVENNATLSPLDGDQMTPIGRAMERGAKKSAQYLLQIAEEKKGSVEDFMYNVDIDGSSLLHLAVNSGVLGVVEICVQYGVRIRQPRRADKVTAFHMACEQGSMPIVQFLASKDPAVCRITLVDHRGRTPLHMAAGKNHIHVVEFLLENGATLDPKDDERRSPLFRAANYGADAMVKLLMERGADVTIRDVTLKSVVHAAVGDFKAMEALLHSPTAAALITEKDVDGFSPVHYAAKTGDVKNVKLFVAKNRASSSVLSNSLDTPIHVASRYGWTDVVEALMDNQNVKIINMRNSQGKTGLHFACSEGHDYTTEALLRLGATIDRDQHERTPLHLAAIKGSLPCCEIIVNKSDEHLNDLDKNKNTAMHLAAINGHPGVVKYFLSLPKTVVQKNGNNQNILDIAVSSQFREVATVVAKHERWQEVMSKCSTGLVTVMQVLVQRMPEVAVFFLDQCVEEKGDPESDNYMVRYDLNLVQGQYPGEPLKPDKKSLQLIKTMAQFRRESCLTHPISFTLLNMKWKKFGWLTFAVNLLSYFAFLIPLTSLAVYGRTNEDTLCKIDNSTDSGYEETCTNSDVTTQLLSAVVVIAVAILMAKHIFSLIRKGKAYILNIVNYVEWLCYIATIVYVMPTCDCKKGYKQEVGAVAMFFGWMNLILYFRRLSSYGQYVIMLTTMFVTLLKVLLLWMLFIMAFGCTFFMIMDAEHFGKFSYALMTMYVMTLGELNYHDDFLPWDELAFPALTNVLFVVLVLGMPIIMMNMLVGLAVGDIDKIQQNALMDRYVLQVQLLLDIENSMPMFILKHVQVHSYSEYPNHPKSLKTKLVDGLVSFGKPESTEVEEEEEALSPGMIQILAKMEQQEKRADKMYDMLKEQAEMLKELNQTSREEGAREREENSEEKKEIKLGLFGF
ncbi:hypothetical protein ACROYT_G044086 [Oculina patagonica]